MAENSRQEGSELLLQVGLSGRFVPLQGVTDSMTILEVKHRARDKVAKLLGKEFLSAELMYLLPGDGVDALKVQSPAMAKMSNRRWRVASCHCTLTLPQRVTLSKSNFQIMKISSLTLASFAPYSRTLGSLSRPCSRKMDRSKSRAMAQRGYLFGTIALVTGSAMDNVAQQSIPGIVC